MNLKFLVVDDSVTMRRIVINSLANLNYLDYVEASDGKDALAKLESNPDINFVITDWNMPEMSGLELVKAIRSDERFSELPVLMVTTRGLKNDIIEALKARVNNYILKPFTPQVLREKIEQILSTTITEK
ncbi:MAG: response regulator [Ignavibacterium sp.]|jgi:two-component system chemotaxis response regulator CheY|uniref:response regulator n=1 Tax=Ignavibacterium sp. TaxID=2651167 RepID=UPI0021FC4F00|nr:response regulator [Ignavibacterium sp.]BDQ02871.1 MAG: chemotaxis protein CheY [Ignavibacterium sp.]